MTGTKARIQPRAYPLYIIGIIFFINGPIHSQGFLRVWGSDFLHPDPTHLYKSTDEIQMEERAKKYHIKWMLDSCYNYCPMGKDTSRSPCRVEYYEFNKRGQVVCDTSRLFCNVRFVYNGKGQLVSIISEQDTSALTYDKEGKLIFVEYKNDTFFGSVHGNRLQYYASGLLKSCFDCAVGQVNHDTTTGNGTTWYYDKSGNVIRMEDYVIMDSPETRYYVFRKTETGTDMFDSTIQGTQLICRFDKAGNLTETYEYGPGSTPERIIKSVYNEQGEIVSDEDIDNFGTGSKTDRRIEYQYNEKGLVTQARLFVTPSTCFTVFKYSYTFYK